MGFRVPARSASSDAAASGNMMALLERVQGGVSLIQIRGNRLGAVGKNIPVQHRIDKPNIRDPKFIRI